MSLTRKARLLYPSSRRLAAKWVLAERYRRAQGIEIKPWWGIRETKSAPPNHPA